MRLNRLTIGAGVTSLVIAGAALIPGGALAHEAGIGADFSARVEREHRGGGPGPVGGAGGTELAEALGITTDELRDAVSSVREALRPADRPATPPTEEERTAHHEEITTALAEELGVSVATLEDAQETAEAARKAAVIERIEAKVADGTLTRERADAMIEAIEGGEKPAFRGLHRPRGVRGGAAA